MEENSTSATLFFGGQGHSTSEVRFSISPLTYQQFEDRTGISVSSLLPPGASLPSPAFLGKQSSVPKLHGFAYIMQEN